jgi:hypothetical protein
VRADTGAPGVKVRDTADRDTPARSATSRNVTFIKAPPAFHPDVSLPPGRVHPKSSTKAGRGRPRIVITVQQMMAILPRGDYVQER